MTNSKVQNSKVINVVTLGCSKNTVDSENLMGAFRRGGLEVVHDAPGEGFAGVVINTCGFILDAREESVETILQYARARKEGRIGKLVVMGCLAQRYRQELLEEIPEVDAVLGVNELAAVAALFLPSGDIVHWRDRILSTPSHYAYQKISEGCDHQCSFCAIPLIRGKHRSRGIKEIVDEAVLLNKKGVRELILIAQDLTWYGMDLEGKRMLPELLRRLDEADSPEWIRLHYTYPVNFPLEILDIMTSSSKICNYLDIPLQHVSDRILKSMRRGGDSRAMRQLMDLVRKSYPEIAMRTTMIVGYPGETEQEFEELLDFIRGYRFERLGAFVYSHEEDTPAYLMADDVPAKVKEERLGYLMEVQENIALGNNKRFVGSVQQVLVDREEGEFKLGRTEFDSPEVDNEVLIRDAEDIRPGEFAEIRIEDADAFDLHGYPSV